MSKSTNNTSDEKGSNSRRSQDQVIDRIVMQARNRAGNQQMTPRLFLSVVRPATPAAHREEILRLLAKPWNYSVFHVIAYLDLHYGIRPDRGTIYNMVKKDHGYLTMLGENKKSKFNIHAAATEIVIREGIGDDVFLNRFVGEAWDGRLNCVCVKDDSQSNTHRDVCAQVGRDTNSKPAPVSLDGWRKNANLVVTKQHTTAASRVPPEEVEMANTIREIEGRKQREILEAAKTSVLVQPLATEK